MSKGKVAYLGPAGTFCHEALLSQPDLAARELVPYSSIAEVFESIDSNVCELGVVPLENTIEGSVAVTLDMLVFDSEAMIHREIDHTISLCLASLPGSKKENIDTIVSHPHALAQCRSYISDMGSIKTKASDSTAGAAHIVANAKDKNLACICPKEAAKTYGLEVLDTHIQDRDLNQTRFVVVGNTIAAPTGNDKTSIVCFQRANKPGSLLAILAEFAKRNIDLTKLESRPTKEILGEYCFLMDFVGHIADEHIAECLKFVRKEHADVKFLGSYPVSGDKLEIGDHTNGKVWKDTDQWFEDLYAKIDES